MKARSSGSLLLRLRVAVFRTSPVTVLAALCLVLGLGALAWGLHANRVLQDELAAVKTRAARQAAASAAQAGTPVPVPVPAAAPDNLDAFYAALGPRRHAGEQVKTLFALAAQNGLSLSQGEYKSAFDRNAKVHTYQVNLPVKGSYGAIWQFAFGALRAIPFASLDEISFRRDGIADPVVEARLRLTFYLSDTAGGAP